MSSRPFQHAKIKVDRARKFIAEAEEEFSNFLDQKPYVTTFYEKRDGIDQSLHMSTYTRFPVTPILACIIGDAIHNLRVALDICANDLVALNNVVPKKVYFPFGNDEIHFDAQMKEKMKGANPSAKAAVKALKPWKGGNDALRALHDLDIIDKHYAPLATVTRGYSPGCKIKEVWIGSRKTLMIDTEELKRNLKPVDQNLFTKPQKPPEGFSTLGMCEEVEHTLIFTKGLPLAKEPVFESLSMLVNLVDNIITTFEGQFLNPKR